jgi:uncharacterized protein YkvS
MKFEWKANRNVIDAATCIVTLKKGRRCHVGNIVEFRNAKSVMREPVVRISQKAQITSWQRASRGAFTTSRNATVL